MGFDIGINTTKQKENTKKKLPYISDYIGYRLGCDNEIEWRK